jgi:hypothetical protein
MGYTHYWTIGKLDPEQFVKFSADCEKIIDDCKQNGIAIAGGDGVGKPEITSKEVWFNGSGEDSHETFHISIESKGFDFCKTARKPYDLAVAACLVAAKHHFGDQITISSDGGMDGFTEGIEVCKRLFGYGLEDSEFGEND